MDRICWNCMEFSWNGKYDNIDEEIKMRPHEKILRRGRCIMKNMQVWLDCPQTAINCEHYEEMDENDPVPEMN